MKQQFAPSFNNAIEHIASYLEQRGYNQSGKAMSQSGADPGGDDSPHAPHQPFSTMLWINKIIP